MQINLPYGKTFITAEAPFTNLTILEPRFVEGLTDEKSAFSNAVRSPINARPLRRIIGRSDKVAVLVPDITRPFPSQRILPWLFSELAHVRADNISVIIGTGSHRPCAPAELEEMLGAEIVARYRIVNHNAHDFQTMLPVGRREDGGTLYMNREYTAADRRILMGFIEPHFMAGFSGGYKAVMPGVADINSILYYHRSSVVGHPQSTWGVLENNPTQELIQKFGSRMPVDFCVNVTLNRKRCITGFFCGDPVAAHLKGCEFARESTMVKCARRFPVVITSNGGYPLDQNLYQSVKGISAAAQIVDDGGLIIAVCECADGFPAHGNFARLLFEHNSPQAILDTVLKPGFSMFDQWEAQLLAMIQVRAKVALFSALPADEVRRAHMDYVESLNAYLVSVMRRLGENTPVAVLPDGPLTIPEIGVKSKDKAVKAL
ncbi:MAG: nickel-dependent lactate racemase [Verrucomicrobia bacterium]|nr:nickel-dependent lactate racemase [Verrucomicrobiota bacterium]